MGPRVFALALSTGAAILVESFLHSFLAWPASLALGFIAAVVAYYYAYPILKRLREGDL